MEARFCRNPCADQKVLFANRVAPLASINDRLLGDGLHIAKLGMTGDWHKRKSNSSTTLPFMLEKQLTIECHSQQCAATLERVLQLYTSPWRHKGEMLLLTVEAITEVKQAMVYYANELRRRCAAIHEHEESVPLCGFVYMSRVGLPLVEAVVTDVQMSCIDDLKSLHDSVVGKTIHLKVLAEASQLYLNMLPPSRTADGLVLRMNADGQEAGGGSMPDIIAEVDEGDPVSPPKCPQVGVQDVRLPTEHYVDVGVPRHKRHNTAQSIPTMALQSYIIKHHGMAMVRKFGKLEAAPYFLVHGLFDISKMRDASHFVRKSHRQHAANLKDEVATPIDDDSYLALCHERLQLQGERDRQLAEMHCLIIKLKASMLDNCAALMSPTGRPLVKYAWHNHFDKKAFATEMREVYNAANDEWLCNKKSKQ